jgi:hypothetical protein
MRDIMFWLSGAALAFLVTAGAFLLLANLATAPSQKRLNPEQARAGSGQSVDLILDREQLASLRYLPDQSLTLEVENEGGEQLSDVSVILSVFSENTALSNFRHYRKTVQKIPAGEAASVCVSSSTFWSPKSPLRGHPQRTLNSRVRSWR